MFHHIRVGGLFAGDNNDPLPATTLSDKVQLTQKDAVWQPRLFCFDNGRPRSYDQISKKGVNEHDNKRI